MTGSTGARKLEIVAATDAHAAELSVFYAAVWDAASSPADVLAARASAAMQNLADPGVPPPTFLAIQSGRVLGHVSSLPIRIWDGHRVLRAYWIKGLMVLPEFRNGPIGFRVLQKAAGHFERSLALAVAPAARRLFGALGYEDLGPIPNFLQPLAPGRILSRLDFDRLGLGGLPPWMPRAVRLARRTGVAALAGGIGGLVMRTATAAVRLRGIGFRDDTAWPSDLPAHLDRLWEMARSSLDASVVRDGVYLMQRYGSPSESGPYQWVGAWNGDVLCGVAILRAPREQGDVRLAGIRVATVADLLVKPDRAACLALLGAIERRARSFDADGIVSTMSSTWLGPSLALQGYLRLPGNVHFLVRDVSAHDRRLRGPLGDWWLTRGDGESDQVF